LASAGLLKVAYTDFNLVGQKRDFLEKLSFHLSEPRFLKKISGRAWPSTVPQECIKSHPRYLVEQIIWNRVVKESKVSARFACDHQVGSFGLARRLVKDNFGGANSLYAHACSATRAVHVAKSRGIFIALEAISEPFHKLVDFNEHRRFGREYHCDRSVLVDNLQFFKEEADLADAIIVASEFVYEGLVKLGIAEKKLRIVPYGFKGASEIDRNTQKNGAGRILFVGNVNYLKGIPCLSEARKRLEEMGLNLEFRIVGSISPDYKRREEFKGLDYVGQVARSQVRDEYSMADLFVFPTLSDGFGIVLLEAMSSGLPIVATTKCARVVRHGENGLVVSENNPEELAKAIFKIIKDKNLREKMSASSIAIAKQYSIEKYTAALSSTLEEAFADWRQ
jgi:glycosyltransferase involved in cell wall biosynthesis